MLPSTSPSRSEPKPSRETRFRVVSGDAPPLAAALASPPASRRRSRATPASLPSDLDPTAQNNLDPSQTNLSTGQLRRFCSLAL
jgi:hypothetical protein